MPASVTIDLSFFRHDSEAPPYVTIADLVDVGYLKLADWTYRRVNNGVNLLLPLNRSKPDCPVKVRDLAPRTWTVVAPIAQSTEDPDDTGQSIYRTSGESFNGGYCADALDPDLCSLQAKITSISLSSGMSLQNHGDPISHNYLDTSIPHGMVFGQEGRGAVREFGVVPIVNGSFKYEVGDTGMIELTDGVVRYFLIKSDGTMQLLRTTRSKLTDDPKAEVLVYYPNSRLDNILILDGAANEVQPTEPFESVGVLENFQDWMNDFFWASTSDPIQMADNNMQYTFPNHKKQLRTLAANLNRRDKEDRDEFVAFFNYHGMEIAYIFVDNAHKDTDGNATEFWAKFTSPFGDKARGSCLSAHTAQITEDYRNDYIPKKLDPDGPTTPTLGGLTSGPNSGQITMDINAATNNVILYQYQIRLDSGTDDDYSDPIDLDYRLHYILTGLTPGTYYRIRVRAMDYSERFSAWSPSAAEQAAP